MARFFKSTSDLVAWVKNLGAHKAATAIANIPKVGDANLMDIAETTKRICEANDSNAAETLFDLLKSAGVANDDVEKAEASADHVQVAEDLLKRKVISNDEYQQMVKQAQIMRQPGEYDMPLRICPKLPWSVGKKLISTYNCRHYCLDGIVLDDDPTRVYCGELLWRRHVADKFSQEYQDRKTGEWVGGYVNDRFFKFPDAGTPANPDVPRNGGNPMSLKPGERTRIPRPHQWSTERRMQEAREKGSTKDHTLGKTASGWMGRNESSSVRIVKANSSLGSGLYVEFSIDSNGNLVITPTQEGIAEAKNHLNKGDTSDMAFLSMIADFLSSDWSMVDPEDIGALTSCLIITNEGTRDDQGQLTNIGDVWSNIEYYQIKSEISDFADGKSVIWNKAKSSESTPISSTASKKKGKPVNPWAVCHTTVDKDENLEKFEKCVLDVKKKHPVKKAQVDVMGDVGGLAAASYGALQKVVDGVNVRLLWTMSSSESNKVEFQWPENMLIGSGEFGAWVGNVYKPDSKEKLIDGSERKNLEKVWSQEVIDAVETKKNQTFTPKLPWSNREHVGEEDVARQVLAQAGGMIKVSSEAVKDTEGDGNVFKAFSMAVDLQASGVKTEDAVIKMAEATGLTFGKATVILEMAVRKMAAHTGDTYVTDKKSKQTKPKGPQVRPDSEVQQDAEELALTEE